jgi:hypothetical protein
MTNSQIMPDRRVIYGQTGVRQATEAAISTSLPRCNKDALQQGVG